GSPGLPQDYFTLGGFHRLSGFGRGELSGPHAGLARLVFYRELGPGRGVLDMPLYIGASLEAGNAWLSRDDIALDTLIVNGSVFAGIDTWLGRLFVGAGFAEGGGENLYLIFGNPWPLRR
ncbi:MAG: patatin, partial [Gammaproteobacteria bacterium]|nr:patatin [Gammaproteobacteria bacterium]